MLWGCLCLDYTPPQYSHWRIVFSNALLKKKNRWQREHNHLVNVMLNRTVCAVAAEKDHGTCKRNAVLHVATQHQKLDHVSHKSMLKTLENLNEWPTSLFFFINLKLKLIWMIYFELCTKRMWNIFFSLPVTSFKFNFCLHIETILGSYKRVYLIFGKQLFKIDNWSHKAIRRRTTGTGRMRYLKTLPRRFANGFREGLFWKFYFLLKMGY